MKITNFSNLILTPKADEIIAFFNDLGFERDHQKDYIEGGTVTSTVMKNPDGFMISISQAPVSQTMTVIRMNVDDFDKAFAYLSSKGFVNQGGDQLVENESSKSALMTSPSGFAFSICQHYKK